MFYLRCWWRQWCGWNFHYSTKWRWTIHFFCWWHYKMWVARATWRLLRFFILPFSTHHEIENGECWENILESVTVGYTSVVGALFRQNRTVLQILQLIYYLRCWRIAQAGHSIIWCLNFNISGDKNKTWYYCITEIVHYCGGNYISQFCPVSQYNLCIKSAEPTQ